MAIKSRLRRRRPQRTGTIYTKSVSGSYAETATYNNINLTHEQRDAFELMTDTGTVIMVTDVWWAEPVDGTLPNINEGQVLVVDSVRYEVMQVVTYDYTERVRVMTRRAR